MLLNIYSCNSEAPKYIKQILNDIKGEIDNNTIIGGDFNTPHTSMHRLSRQKINKATVVLNDTTDKLILEICTGRACVHIQSLNRIQLFVIPWTVGCVASLSMEFSKNTEVGCHFLTSGDLPVSRIKHISCISCTGRQILYH